MAMDMQRPEVTTGSARHAGFTLSELLIALSILGLIAAFAIPKVLQTQQDNKDKATTKEIVAMVSGAFEAYKAQGKVTGNTWFYDLTPYFNYVKLDTTTVLDDSPNATTIQCQSYKPCYQLASGAVIMHDEDRIGGTSATNAVYFMVDPDGKSGSTNKSVYFLIYANGKIRTWGTMNNPTATQSNIYTPNPATDPSWFTWN